MFATLWPNVSIAVLNYNGSVWLPRCLESLAHTTYPNLDVAVIDNNSDDGSQELVRRTYPRVRLFALERNFGFAGAYNRFLKSCSSLYLGLLNNDTVVIDPDWVFSLVSVMERDRSIAAASCKMLYLNQPEYINSVGGGAYWWTGSFDIGDGELDRGQYDDPPIEPFAFCGGAALLRVPAVREVGGFDETVFGHREDFDLSWRLRLRGYHTVYVPVARVLHVGGGTWGPMSYSKLYLSSRNWLRLMLKNYTTLSLLRGLPVYLAFELAVRLPGLIWLSRSLRFALIPFQSLFWNIAYLRDTLRARHQVQLSRRVSEQTILRAMGSAGFEPLAHLLHRANTLRRISSMQSDPQRGGARNTPQS